MLQHCFLLHYAVHCASVILQEYAMNQRLKHAVLLCCCTLSLAGAAQAEPSAAARLDENLLPSRLPVASLWQQPLPGPRKQVEMPWLLQAAGALAMYAAEYRTKEQYDSGRPLVPPQDHPSFFYPTAQRTGTSETTE